MNEELDPLNPFLLAARTVVASKRVISLWQMAFNLRVVIDDGTPWGISDGYCFHVRGLAWEAFHGWDGKTPPAGFAKNPTTGVYGDCPCEACEAERAQQELWKP